jgi:rod shape-determining protein MreD
MRWLTWITLAVVAVVVQSTLAPRFALWGLRPDWLLALVLFAALFAPSRDALLASWILGLLADLMSLERCGVQALTYLLVAWVTVLLREYLFRYRLLTQFVLAAGVAIGVRFLWWGYQAVLYPAAETHVLARLTDCLFGGVYTAAWAAAMVHLLSRRARWFGFPQPRYAHASFGGRW